MVMASPTHLVTYQGLSLNFFLYPSKEEDEKEKNVVTRVKSNVEFLAFQSKDSKGFATGFIGTDYTEDKAHSLYLNCLKRGLTAGRSGVGTSLLKSVVELSWTLNLEGHVHLQACRSSHIFWLKMGFLPYESTPKTNFAELEEELNSANINHERVFIRILREETDIKAEEVTEEIILENKELLLSVIAERKTSKLRDEFFPTLLNAIKICLKNEEIDTSHLGQIAMYLSDHGRIRWLKALKDNMPFEPFRKLEHLRPLMSTTQQKQLDDLMTRWEKKGRLKFAD